MTSGESRDLRPLLTSVSGYNEHILDHPRTSKCNMSDSPICPNCRREDVVESVPHYHTVAQHTCRFCGKFVVDRRLAFLLARECKTFEIPCLIRELNTRRHVPALVNKDFDKRLAATTEYIDVSDFQGRFPRRLAERLDRALLNLGRMSKLAGDSIPIDDSLDSPLLFARNDVETKYMLLALQDAGFVNLAGVSAAGGKWPTVVTPEGWNRIADLEESRVGIPSGQIFVAMWFGGGGTFLGQPAVDFMKRVFTDGMRVGAARAGYRAQRVDFLPFNEDIVAQIITDIKRSQLVIADFTRHRRGVYFEAGFARGVGLPVISTCHRDFVHLAHFDTRNTNHLLWTDPADLAAKLERWIVTTTRQGPLDPDPVLKEIERDA